jgi:hypothetical protein
VVHGGSGNDQLEVAELSIGQSVRVFGGTGDDRATLYALSGGDQVGGGDGRDELTVYALTGNDDALVGNLGTGRFNFKGDHASYGMFEDWQFTVFGPLVITGSDNAETLRGDSRGLTAHMGGGDDYVFSGVGNHISDDLVDGGDGADTADLGDGIDACINIELGPC